jgi:hypothetical protein
MVLKKNLVKCHIFENVTFPPVSKECQEMLIDMFVCCLMLMVILNFVMNVW